MFEPAAEAIDEAFLFGPIARRVIGDDQQMGVLPTGQAIDQGHQRIEVALAMTGWVGRSNCNMACLMAR